MTEQSAKSAVKESETHVTDETEFNAGWDAAVTLIRVDLASHAAPDNTKQWMRNFASKVNEDSATLDAERPWNPHNKAAFDAVMGRFNDWVQGYLETDKPDPMPECLRRWLDVMKERNPEDEVEDDEHPRVIYYPDPDFIGVRGEFYAYGYEDHVCLEAPLVTRKIWGSGPHESEENDVEEDVFNSLFFAHLTPSQARSLAKQLLESAVGR
jgi:hypothetical protein